MPVLCPGTVLQREPSPFPDSVTAPKRAPVFNDGDDPAHCTQECPYFAQANVSRATQWRRWQSDADDIWKDRPDLSRHSVARLVKRRLQVPERTDSIACRIRK